MTALLVDALSELGGYTITVRHELAPPSQRLMDTLGVTVLIDPAAPACTKFFCGPRNVYEAGQTCRKCLAIEAGVVAAEQAADT